MQRGYHPGRVGGRIIFSSYSVLVYYSPDNPHVERGYHAGDVGVWITSRHTV